MFLFYYLTEQVLRLCACGEGNLGEDLVSFVMQGERYEVREITNNDACSTCCGDKRSLCVVDANFSFLCKNVCGCEFLFGKSCD